MNVLTRLARLTRRLAGRGRWDTDLDAEVDGYLDMLADEKIAAGLPPDEAYRQARLEMDGPEQVKERVRDVRSAAWLDTLARDVKHGARAMAASPVFSGAVVMVLALGIAANVAVFDVVNLLLLKPRVGVEHPETLVALHAHDPKRPDSYRRFAYRDYEAIRAQRPVFSSVAAHRHTRVILADAAGARSAIACAVTASYFPTLGTRLALGRNFTGDEERPGSRAAVAILGHAAWQALGGDASVLGRTLTLNSRPFTIVGVAPEGFTGTLASFAPTVWVPLGAEVLFHDDGDGHEGPTPDALRSARAFSLVARLRNATASGTLTAALDTLSPGLDLSPDDPARHDVVTANALARTEDSDTPEDDAGLFVPLGALAAMAALLLVVASLNVANMLLARGAARHKEIATRLALGAGRLRIVGQLFAENALLTLAAGAAGLLLGTWAVRAAAASFAPLVDEVLVIPSMPDIRVLGATTIFCVASAVVCALGPALRLSRTDVIGDIKGRSTDGGPVARLGPRNLLVAWQVALSLALLATAGLFVRAAVAAGHANPGYDLERQVLVVADASGLSAARAGEASAAIVDALGTTAGVESAAPTSLVAFTNNHLSRAVAATGATAAPTTALQFTVGANYFSTIGLRLVRGRVFTTTEERAPGQQHLAIVDEPLAQRLFPGADPIGRSLEFPAARPGEPPASLLIVGLVAGQRDRLSDGGVVPHVYLPSGALGGPRLSVHVRVSAVAWADRAALMARLAAAVKRASPDVALLGVSTLAEARDRVPTNWLIRAAGAAFGYLGLAGLAMAVTGLYGVKSYLVTRRTREIGIRMALGARPRDIVAAVVRDGTASLAAGVAIGLALASGAGALVSRMVVGVHPLDRTVFACATLVLVVSVAAASYLPARRATRIEPSLAFRSE